MATQEAGVVCQSIPVCLLVVGADLVAQVDLVISVVSAEEVGQVHAMREGQGWRRVSRFGICGSSSGGLPQVERLCTLCRVRGWVAASAPWLLSA